MAEITNFAYDGAGEIWVGDDEDDDLRSLGNVIAAELSFSNTEDNVPDRRTCAGGNYASNVTIDAANINITFSDHSPENAALAFFGETSAIAEAAATEEVQVVPTTTNRLLKTDFVIKTSVAPVISSVTGGAGTVYVVGTDYNVTVGGIEYLLTGSLSGGETVYVNYTKRAVTRVEAIMAASSTKYLQINGLNCSNSGAPVVVRIWKYKPSPAEAFAMISEGYAEFVLNGTMDADPAKGTSVSQYFQEDVATTT